jgi:hypothetical protein
MVGRVEGVSFLQTLAHLVTVGPPDGFDETFEEGDKGQRFLAAPDIGDVAVFHNSTPWE